MLFKRAGRHFLATAYLSRHSAPRVIFQHWRFPSQKWHCVIFSNITKAVLDEKHRALRGGA
jgi:hypothetical protein